jgi:hypothetical protein
MLNDKDLATLHQLLSIVTVRVSGIMEKAVVTKPHSEDSTADIRFKRRIPY